MRIVSIKEAILNVFEDIGDQRVSMNTLLRWAKYVEQNINSFRGYAYKNALRTIENCKAKIPDDAIRIVTILLGDYMDECDRFTDLYRTSLLNTYTDEYGIEKYWIDLNAIVVSPLIYEIEQENVTFTSDYEGDEVTIQYHAFRTDSEGYIIVNESHVDAIEAYIEWKLAKMSLHKIFRNEKIMRQGHQTFALELKSDYHRMIRKARGEDAKMTPKEIYDLWNEA